jgi:hypothetical protein
MSNETTPPPVRRDGAEAALIRRVLRQLESSATPLFDALRIPPPYRGIAAVIAAGFTAQATLLFSCCGGCLILSRSTRSDSPVQLREPKAPGPEAAQRRIPTSGTRPTAGAEKRFEERLASGDQLFLDATTMQIGDTGLIDHPVRVLQIQPDGRFLAVMDGQIVLFAGVDSSGLADGREYNSRQDPFEVLGTTSYINTLGARRTVMVLLRFDGSRAWKNVKQARKNKTA